MNTTDDEFPSPSLLGQMSALLPLLVIFVAVLQWFYIDRLADYTPEREIRFELPSIQAHSRILAPDTLTIDIHRDGTVSITGVLSEAPNSSDLPLLRRHLQSTRDAVNRHGGLVVRPDSTVSYQRLIDVLSAVTASGISFYGLT
jgi:biopolymer transport protein ExbD